MKNVQNNQQDNLDKKKAQKIVQNVYFNHFL